MILLDFERVAGAPLPARPGRRGDPAPPAPPANTVRLSDPADPDNTILERTAKP